jgi:hypothetical protein
VLTLVFAVLQVQLLARIVNILAPPFKAVPDPTQALKLAAYACTPLLLAGVVNLVPFLGVLWLVAALYGVYIAFIGLPILMRCPTPQAGPYALAVGGAAFGLWMLASAIITAIMGFGPAAFD